jgi:hypothetical protein
MAGVRGHAGEPAAALGVGLELVDVGQEQDLDAHRRPLRARHRDASGSGEKETGEGERAPGYGVTSVALGPNRSDFAVRCVLTWR